ncbi:hypothetical protein [Mesobacillus zeae]|uniref:Uncharacterized protein n=1 Tax=Mesobacillus zeae TaxID=1917180 RepID=A0A398B4F9_9BACI|nr:hypothetical protein [Mesobacillus zeae]RID84939.1 hypothetical protein D1970_11405 [Mesobacillus zeae]
MEEIQKMKLETLKSKNSAMFYTLLISLIAAGFYSVAANKVFEIWVYGIEILIFTGLFIVLQYVLKKESLFPYLSIVLLYSAASTVIIVKGAL